MTSWRSIATAVVVAVVSTWDPPSGGLLTRTASASPQAVRTTNDAVFTAEQAKRGEILYQFVCATCHGPALTGIEAAPPLAGTTFGASWSGAPVSDLFERIRVSMPQGDPMSLSRAQKADILAYVLFRGSYPDGETELPSQTEVLRTISFLAAKPSGP